MKNTIKQECRLLLPCLFTALMITACSSTASPHPTKEPLPAQTATTAPTALPPTEPATIYTPTPEPEIDSPTWFDDAILYEIFVRSFVDDDGDGIGDLAGLTTELDHLKEMGATAVWLMPIHPSPSYHGYDVTDYFDVNPDYGTLEDMIAFVDAAHERGIRVIIDLVVNHSSNEHPFFQDADGDPDSKYADWFLWTNDSHTTYETFGGFKHLPKLNHDNPEVVEYVLEIARFWMDIDGDGAYDGVDGFRADVAKEVPLSTWQPLRAEMRNLNPESFLLGEVWEGNAQNLAKWYDDAFDALFDFPLYHELAGNHDENMDGVLAGARPPNMLNSIIVGQDALFPPGYQIVRFVNNHDTNRALSDVGEDWKRAQTAATLNLTLPGTPMIYYGEEIGMLGEKGQGNPYWDEYRREPMDWYAAEEGKRMTTWFRPADRFNAPDDGISVEEQEQEVMLINHYRALAKFRHAHRALRTGAFGKVKVTDGEGVYAFTRHAPASGDQLEEWFLVILNFSSEARSPVFALNLVHSGPFTAVDPFSGQAWPEVPAGQSYQVDLEPTSSVVLQLSPP